MQNEHGQGVSHATGDSKVPGSVQQKAPQGLEESLPNKVSSYSILRGKVIHGRCWYAQVHDTGSGTGRQTHAKDGGDASIVPKGIQKAVPEKLERVLPDSIHDTGDHGGAKHWAWINRSF